MNIAIVLAAGTGTRLGADIPKQYIEVDGKPIICYVLEILEKDEQIDEILIVCLEDWIEHIHKLTEKYNISKFKECVLGGKTNQESEYNGALAAKKLYNSDDLIIYVDSVRPLITGEIIDDNIKTAREYGIGVSAIKMIDVPFKTADGVLSDSCIERNNYRVVHRPIAMTIGKANQLFEKAYATGTCSSSCVAELAVNFGERVAFSKGAETNFKITHQIDIELFKTVLNQR